MAPPTRECREGLWLCSKCGEWKSADSFSKSTRKKSGLRSNCKQCGRRDWQRYYSSLPKSKRHARTAKARVAKFGVSQEQYDEMLKKQGFVCAICDEPCKFGWQLAVDHNHLTGEIRDLLCARCNTTIGKVNESISLLNRMTSYLEKWT